MPDDLTAAIARSWTLPLGPTIALLVISIVYMRGWLLARQTRPRELPAWRAWCFFGGEAAVWLALASPIDALGQFLLVAHMTQHLVLMSVAPPLMLLGRPIVPLLRGLPRQWVRDDLAPWMNLRTFEKARKFIMHPLVGWISMNVAFIGWHIPAAYELALRANGWHDVEHACFFLTSMLFWWHVIQPWPSRSAWSRWTIPLYLISADLVNTGLSAFLAFYGQVAYPTYAAAPRIFSISALDDQAAAGAEMWVIGSTIFLVPAVLSIAELLMPARRGRIAAVTPKTGHVPSVSPRFDLLRTPIAGAFLRSRYGRIALQAISSLAMVAVIADGLHGTPLSSMNLAGSLVWNIIRPVSLLLILAIGNFFCMACPFTLPREAARRLGIARFRWPRWLSGKWPAIALMLLFFWAYEQIPLWDSPRATAPLLLAYVLTVLLVDSVFRGASFCKHLCPIGQFNFVASLVSPFGVNIRNESACGQCSTHDCVRGNETQRGCELQLYLPQKVGNMDCTMCMDCVKACPHDNIGITVTVPALDLLRDPPRSSLGRLSQRMDIAVLLLFVFFASLMNAAYMIAPVANQLDLLGQQYPFLASNLGSLLLPVSAFGVFLLFWFAFAWTLKKVSAQESKRYFFCRFALAVVPLGLAIWSAHLGFHLATSSSSVSAMIQHTYTDMPSMMGDDNSMMQGMAGMTASCRPLDVMLLPGAKGLNLFSLQLWALDLGMLLSLYIGWRIVRQIASSPRRSAVMIAIWIACACALYAVGIWLFTQPMQMRGMSM